MGKRGDAGSGVTRHARCCPAERREAAGTRREWGRTAPDSAGCGQRQSWGTAADWPAAPFPWTFRCAATLLVDSGTRPNECERAADEAEGSGQWTAYLNPDFGKTDFESEFFARVDVRVVGLFERLLQLVQLKCGERGPVTAVLLTRRVIAATLAAGAAGIVFIVSVVSSGAGLVVCGGCGRGSTGAEWCRCGAGN